MDKKMIIFGCGKIGYQALTFLGEQNVECFCDNNSQLTGTIKYGKTVISFDMLKENFKDDVVVIAVGDLDSYDIAKQCEKNGILDYVAYKLLIEMFPQWGNKEIIQFLYNYYNRIFLRQNLYYKEVKTQEEKIEQLQEQIEYFKSHVDIRKMKPATGSLRTRQLEWVKASAEFFAKIEGLGINPILYGGNLLGLVRHNGFIPWDDDMDFALIRDEYEKLKEFCRQHIYDADSGADQSYKDVPKGMENYVYGERYHFFFINKHSGCGHYTGMDFFSLDYYAEDYTFRMLKNYADKYRKGLIELTSDVEKLRYVKLALEQNEQNTVKESNHIFFGIDNMEFMQAQYPKEQFIPREVIFPLKRALFEGEYFWIPNDAEELLRYEFEDIMEFPDDVGIQKHCENIEE